MKLPSAKYSLGITSSTQVKFYGLDRSCGAGDGKIRDMKNMTGDHYPVLAVRQPRQLERTLSEPGGIFWHGELCYVDSGLFYYAGQAKGQVVTGAKWFAAIGNYIVIMPDKCYYDRVTDTFGQLEARWEGASLTFGDGLYFGEEAEANCIRAEGVTWSDYFRAGDAVSISGCQLHPENNKTAIIRQLDGDRLYFYEWSFGLEDNGEYTETGSMAVARTMPEMQMLCENENRLWGHDGRTIWASKLGDPFNWYAYDGLDSDAWAVTPGCAGEFQGCISYKGYAVFAKETKIYKVYGSIPSSYNISGSASLGLRAGCGGSLAVAGETLFYLGNAGIMAYGGGIPQLVSEDLGTERFLDAVAGSDGLKYYISLQSEDGTWGLYVFDTRRNFWHKEDDIHVTHFARGGDSLWMLTDSGKLWRLGSAEADDQSAEGKLEWMVELADITEDQPEKKGTGKLVIRLELEAGAEMTAFLQFDSDGIWHPVRHVYGEGLKRSYILPVIPRRCDHYRLRLEGRGECRIYSISREYRASTALKSKQGRN